MGEMHRLFPAAEKLWSEVDDARRRDRDLSRKPQVAAAEPARPEHVRSWQPTSLEPEESDNGACQDEYQRDPRQKTGTRTHLIHGQLENDAGGRSTFARNLPAVKGFPDVPPPH